MEQDRESKLDQMKIGFLVTTPLPTNEIELQSIPPQVPLSEEEPSEKPKKIKQVTPKKNYWYLKYSAQETKKDLKEVANRNPTCCPICTLTFTSNKEQRKHYEIVHLKLKLEQIAPQISTFKKQKTHEPHVNHF